jgi:hypothetical protein
LYTFWQTKIPSKIGVVKKHDFCGIQRKIPQKSDFANNRDMNPLPHLETAADIAKMFAQIFCENRFSQQKTQFLLKSDRETANFPSP